MLGTVTLTTDFGTGDPYVGAIKGVLLSTSPQIQLIDLSHDVPPQDILAGAYLLQHAAVEFPAGTVHLAVVDPGVGSARRALVVDAGGYHWVGPDNGLFSFALGLPGARAFEITHPDLQRDRLSATFHGRDLFAPTAARLAAGFCVVNVGPAIDDPVRLAPTRTVVNSTLIEGAIVHLDHFGNAVSCICSADLACLGDPSRLRVTLGKERVGLVETYADVEPGNLTALIGSGDLLEIVVRDGNAAQRLGLQRGDPVSVERCP
ncbi:MAG TPA: SAM-dependent chlorinase/fluorinase [Candidatus Latescibacteria bacterium]|nr:hypothetical protein [Gemmatimonadaceae bacterium]MDP6019257.1 SAM-dependent chlorinase/fluorinase [Candidatus Latescibacterota bacterium]HJP33620.1 SAM-dependent chlorinase/fluorinase [Candidatus Latescibacterota bacterium]